MAKELYIIGNGFDLHHGLQTRYQLFAFFLQDNYPDIYEQLINYYPLPDIDRYDENDPWDPIWAEFEKRMAELDYESVLDDNRDYVANPSADDFRDRDWHAYQFQMEAVVRDLTTNLFKAFKEFILAVDYPADIDKKRLKLTPDAYYISFNYTDTLERYYGVPADHILYIHKKAADPDATLILGHGIDPDNFKEKPVVPPVGLSEEELEDWQNYMADQSDYSSDSARYEILGYFGSSFKDTAQVIKGCATFFDMVKDADHIITMGHSLSDVDKPYLQHIADINDKKAPWSVSYFSDWEFTANKEAIVSLGVPEGQVTMYKMQDLLE